MPRRDSIPQIAPLFDEHLDCAGKKRRFRLSVYAGGRFAEAVEVLGGDRFGWRFLHLVREGDPPPWGELRDRIRAHLSRRDVVKDERGQLHLLH